MNLSSFQPEIQDLYDNNNKSNEKSTNFLSLTQVFQKYISKRPQICKILKSNHKPKCKNKQEAKAEKLRKTWNTRRRCESTDNF